MRVKKSKRSLWRKFLVRIRLLQSLQREPLFKSESDLRLKEIKSFDEWLAYIKEKDPQAVEELEALGKTPFKRRGVN